MPHAESPPAPPPFAELYCRSCFSFLTGASHPDELLTQAASLGYTALAITDECSLAGMVRAYAAWQQQGGIQLIVGTHLQLADGPGLVLLATDRGSYGRLSSLITRGRRAAEKGSYHLTRADLDAGLPGCLALLLPPGDVACNPQQLARDADWLALRFPGSAWLAAPRLLGPEDEARRQQGLSLRLLFRPAVGLALFFAHGVESEHGGDQHEDSQPAAPCEEGIGPHAGACALGYESRTPDKGAEHQHERVFCLCVHLSRCPPLSSDRRGSNGWNRRKW